MDRTYQLYLFLWKSSYLCFKGNTMISPTLFVNASHWGNYYNTWVCYKSTHNKRNAPGSFLTLNPLEKSSMLAGPTHCPAHCRDSTNICWLTTDTPAGLHDSKGSLYFTSVLIPMRSWLSSSKEIPFWCSFQRLSWMEWVILFILKVLRFCFGFPRSSLLEPYSFFRPLLFYENGFSLLLFVLPANTQWVFPMSHTPSRALYVSANTTLKTIFGLIKPSNPPSKDSYYLPSAGEKPRNRKAC